MKTTKILEIGGSEFALAATVTDAEALQLISILSKGTVPYRSGYLPSAKEQYGDSVGYIEPRAVDVKLGVTSREVLSQADFYERREQGQKAYDEAHPKDRAAS